VVRRDRRQPQVAMFSLKDVLHRKGLTQGQQLLLVLGSLHPQPLTVKVIKETAVKAGLRRVRDWNVPTILGRQGGLAISTPQGWELSIDGWKAVSSLAGTSPERALRPEPSDDVHANVLLITALGDELQSVMEAFAPESSWVLVDRADNTYDVWSTPIRTEDGTRLSAVATRASAMGMTPAAIRATQAIQRFRPNLVVMTGVAAGTKSSRRHFGDPLIADPCVDYASGKVSADKGKLVFEADPYPLPLDAHVRTVLSEVVGKGLYLDEIRRAWPGNPPSESLNAHLGPLASGDQVIDARGPVAEVRKRWRKLIGLEMEVYAVYRAAREAAAPQPAYFCVKAVCDFAEGKTDVWRPYARYVASHYARRIVLSEWPRLTGSPRG
jgi:nucleoside phosphorylase